MIKRLRMAWCALRGGHLLKVRRQPGVLNCLILECARCSWTALIFPSDVQSVKLAPRGQTYRGFYMDDVTSAEKCPDCHNSPETHLLYRNGKCPVVRVVLPNMDEAMPADDRCPVCRFPYVRHRYNGGVWNCPTTTGGP